MAAQPQEPSSSWQDELEFRQRPPTSSTSDYSEHSFHVRSKSSANVLNSPKRLSMFGARTRSNTTTSTTRSPASSTSGETPMPPPHDEKPAPSDSVARSLLLRGSRILRRQGSKLNVAPTLDEEDEGAKAASKFEVANIFQRPQRMKRTDSHEQLKRIISEPYNFHHVTHTSSNQFHALDNTSSYELVDEFSAIQASQTPEPGLRGIRAQDLHSAHASSENLHDMAMEEERNKAASPSTMSPPTSPKSPGRIENFSRPVSRLNKPLPPAPSMVPPPRSSSRQAYVDIPEPTSQAMDEYLGLNSQLSMPDYPYVRSKEVELPRMNGAEVFYSDAAYQAPAHQNDDDAQLATAVINSYLSDLEDVPEEDQEEEEAQEEQETKDNSHVEPSPPQPLPKDDVDKKAPALTLSQPAPISRESVVVVQDPQLSFSEDLMSPTLPQFRPIAHSSPLSQASDAKTINHDAGFEEFSTSWDEDIDFCYEHAAEADCDFDWNRSSLDMSRSPVKDVASGINKRLTAVNSLPLSSIPNTPELDPGSAQSILTRSHEAITPLSEGAAPVEFFPAKAHDKEYLKLQTNDIGEEPGYEEFLAVQDDSDGQVHYYPERRSYSVDAPVSPRSSYSPISKCNSQESVMLSRAASIVRKHRSSTSTTSVPDLVPSANSSHENTARESIGSTKSTEHGTSAPGPEPPRPAFSYHRQVKSLAPEINLFSNIAAARGNGSIDVIVDMPYPLASPVAPAHDRTKSASAAEHHKNMKMHQRPEGPPAASRPLSLAQKRKSRAGYSLFPTGMAASQR
ncbi:hypothetical protein PISL3812_05591 [Talaromyces islandicus]|uniref:CRIB domain-containing protein n=1 Tax=Talaromyces islandicus TaxID=28573 RepID=A0A0U1M0L9_TALIS|nr:hypothetical protein PISL3812_05591 [Talaromyces islandicus]